MSKIEAVETIPIRVPLDRTYRGSYYQMRTRCTVITRIRTSDGIVGEAYNADSDQEQVEVIRIIQDELAPAVIGRDARNIEGAWEAMLFSTYDQLRDRRPAAGPGDGCRAGAGGSAASPDGHRSALRGRLRPELARPAWGRLP